MRMRIGSFRDEILERDVPGRQSSEQLLVLADCGHNIDRMAAFVVSAPHRHQISDDRHAAIRGVEDFLGACCDVVVAERRVHFRSGSPNDDEHVAEVMGHRRTGAPQHLEALCLLQLMSQAFEFELVLVQENLLRSLEVGDRPRPGLSADVHDDEDQRHQGELGQFFAREVAEDDGP